MPLFIRSLPLSLFTFWRYLIILPLLAIFAFFFSLLGALPVAGLFVPGIVSAGLMIVGLRCALAARGHRNPLDHGTLLTVSAIFCVIFIGTDIFVYGASWLVIWAMTQAGVELDPLGLFVGLFGVSAYWSGVLLALLAPGAIVKAAFAVPMVGAAYAASPRGGDVNYFSGLGKGMFSLLLVMVVWLFGGQIFSIFGEVWAVFGMIAYAIWDLMSGETLTWELMPAVPYVLGGVLVMTWASSWFFATAVLAWEDVVSRQMADAESQRNAGRLSPEDIRALRQSRM